MLTGYNTDVPFDGITYHVQTEDKGLKNPIILSLIYKGGTILGAKRTSYQDLVSGGMVDEARLAKAIERQHQIILAAIRGGKLPHLIERLNASQEQPENAGQAAVASAGEDAIAKGNETMKSAPVVAGRATPPVGPPLPGSSASRVYNFSDFTSDESLNLEATLDDFLKADKAQEKLEIKLFSSTRLVAGEEVTIYAAALYDRQWPAARAAITIRIVGTTISPRTIQTLCDQNGAFNLKLKLPEFNSGTAALIIQAVDAKGQEAEFKLLIRKR